MGRDESMRGSPDDQEVNVHDTDEVRHYARLFNTSEETLKEAVISVGASAAKVKRYLQTGNARNER
jgi:hypothetical protein